jgi:hypothetical protein
MSSVQAMLRNAQTTHSEQGFSNWCHIKPRRMALHHGVLRDACWFGDERLPNLAPSLPDAVAISSIRNELAGQARVQAAIETATEQVVSAEAWCKCNFLEPKRILMGWDG